MAKRIGIGKISRNKVARGCAPLVCLTAYDTPTARLVDAACDLLLVGDSLGMVVHGHAHTLPVQLETMILHAQAVMRASPKALVVVDMPFGSYENGHKAAFEAASRVMKQTGADALKLECGVHLESSVAYLCERGIPVMGHVGLKPQSVMLEGRYRARGGTEEERQLVLRDALATARAGSFSVVLEGIDADLARQITQELPVATIGIGAGPHCDGQILVTQDMWGMNENSAKFVRSYANLGEQARRAALAFARDVRNGDFPGESESYRLFTDNK